MTEIIGRKKETETLTTLLSSNKSELVAVYGRRRVGKTFLIREAYKSHIQFEVTGLYQAGLSEQLDNFVKQITIKSKKKKQIAPIKKWSEAFTLLEEYLDLLIDGKKKVLFIDEFPWIATAKSKFLMYFENFWNSYATKRKDLIVVVCGSAASYMVQKIINNKGGLHNRISQKIRLLPFNLYETELFLQSRKINYTKYDILRLYMVMGGIPHYLEKVKKGDSVAQNIDHLCFDKDGVLNNEFNLLFASLFDNSDKHLRIIKTLASSKKGLLRNTLLEKSKIASGGDFSQKIDELIESGFVTQSTSFEKKTKEIIYRLSDEYSLFYLKFIQGNKSLGAGTWQKKHTSQSYLSWFDFSFETLCLKHIQQIKRALGIESIFSNNCSWINKNAQIDLLIDRDDNIITICELKFSNAPFTISKSYHKDLTNKLNEFRSDSQTRKNIFLTMITTFGVKSNAYSLEIMENELTMECLFEK